MFNWEKFRKRIFMILGNIIELIFLGTLLVGGAYTTFIIFKAGNLLTINFLGVFGVIWTLRWIQKLKSFSSTRNSPYKLTGPLIAIVILISGYAMRSKNTALGPISCVSAPATIWLCSLIFGDIEEKSDDNDEVSYFAVMTSAILLGLVIYAICNPWIYGIEAMDVDGEFVNDLYTIGHLQSIIDDGTEELQIMKRKFEDIKNEISSGVDRSDTEIRKLRLEEWGQGVNIAFHENSLKDFRERLKSLQLKVNLSEKLIENPGLIKDMVEDLEKFQNTYAKPRPIGTIRNIIISLFRRTFRSNEEEIDAE